MNNPFPPVSVIIPAAGLGKRMQTHQNKLLISLDGFPLILYPLRVFEQISFVQEVLLVVSPGNVLFFQDQIVKHFQLKKVKKIVEGGKRRQDSVRQGLMEVSNESQVVLVHDGARPFVTSQIIEESVASALQYGASVVGVPCKATIKEMDEKGFVLRTPPRDRLWEIQTPQAFQTSILREAFQKGVHLDVTDEGMLIEAMGKSVKIIQGNYSNIKITTPEDLALAQMILRENKER